MLKDYAFIDHDRVDSYVDQLGGVRAFQKKRGRKLSLSLKGPSLELFKEEADRPPSNTEKLEFLFSHIFERGMMRIGRPSSFRGWSDEERPPFVFEKTKAESVIFPKSVLPPELGIDRLRVWVSDPMPEDLDGPEWSFRGSFLYLTELRFDDAVPGWFYSGCSALQFIANALSGKDLLTRSPTEPLGRGNSSHPLEKLMTLGAIKGNVRQVETLYRIRYMTDEQIYSLAGREHRVHDILGCPLYIAVH